MNRKTPSLKALPPSLGYIDMPLVPDHEGRLLVAGMADIGDQQKPGVQWVNTIVVPLTRVNKVQKRSGGLHIEYGDRLPDEEMPVVDQISDGEAAHEVLCPSWLNHNIRVFQVAPAFLHAHGLVPRLAGSGKMTWDDPRLPVHDVATVSPNSVWDMTHHSRAEVWIRKEYLEEYAAARNSALVTVYWLERFFFDEPEVEHLMQGTDAIDYSMPGKTIYLRRMIWTDGKPIAVQASGCRLLLRPNSKARRGKEKLALRFPDIPFRVSSRSVHDLEMLHSVFARDELLTRFEDRDEFEIHPSTGSVSHGGHWSLDFTRRMGRDYVSVETRKLFEGCPEEVIRHFHRFAVPRSEAEQQVGQVNIGLRADTFVSGFFDFTEALSEVTTRVGSSQLLTEVGRQQTDYYGWWTRPPFRGLGNVAVRSMTQKSFLVRCLGIRTVFDLLNENSLREAVTASGFPLKTLPNDAGTFLLVGALAREGRLIQRTGLTPRDGSEFFNRLHEVPKVEELRPLLALNDFRLAAAHAEPLDRFEFSRGCETFEIDPASNAAGWGLTFDHVFDRVNDSLAELTRLLAVLAESLLNSSERNPRRGYS